MISITSAKMTAPANSSKATLRQTTHSSVKKMIPSKNGMRRLVSVASLLPRAKVERNSISVSRTPALATKRSSARNMAHQAGASSLLSSSLLVSPLVWDTGCGRTGPTSLARSDWVNNVHPPTLPSPLI